MFLPISPSPPKGIILSLGFPFLLLPATSSSFAALFKRAPLSTKSPLCGGPKGVAHSEHLLMLLPAGPRPSDQVVDSIPHAGYILHRADLIFRAIFVNFLNAWHEKTGAMCPPD
jgi:hypothetical protein